MWETRAECGQCSQAGAGGGQCQVSAGLGHDDAGGGGHQGGAGAGGDDHDDQRGAAPL